MSTIPHRMPDEVPLISLKAGVIQDIRLAEEDVPLIAGEWLTDAGIAYLNSTILDPEDPATEPRHFYRKSWREGLTSAPTRSKLGDMSITSKQTRIQELRRREAELAAEIASAEADLKKARATRANEPRPGTKVLIEAVFPGSDKVYEYLALRTDDRRDDRADWYVTGQQGRVTWDWIIARVERADYVVHELSFLRIPNFG